MIIREVIGQILIWESLFTLIFGRGLTALESTFEDEYLFYVLMNEENLSI